MNETRVDHYDGMLNAGFCAMIITKMAEGAANVRRAAPVRAGLPWILTYLLGPLALHRETARLIKRSRHRGFTEFFDAHPELSVDMDRRITNMAHHVRAGLSMALLRDTVRLDEDRRSLIATRPSDGQHDLRLREILVRDDYDCLGVSARLGEWAVQVPVAQICGALSVRPVWLPTPLATPIGTSLVKVER
jgi:hypothetical protein